MSVPIFGAATRMFAESVSRNNKFTKGTDADGDGNTITVLWCNVPYAILCYTKRETNVQVWDSLFQTAFETALAARICMALTGKAGLAEGLAKEAMVYVTQARVADGNEGLEVYDTTPDWLLARDIDNSVEAYRW